MERDEEKTELLVILMGKMCILYTKGLVKEALRLLSFIVDVYNLKVG